MEAHTYPLEIRPTGKFGPKGERYEVYAGDEMIAKGHSPEFAACRVLKERGLTGAVKFSRAGKSPHLTMGIEWGATHTVTESAKLGLRFSKWVPNDRFSSEDNGDEASELISQLRPS